MLETPMQIWSGIVVRLAILWPRVQWLILSSHGLNSEGVILLTIWITSSCSQGHVLPLIKSHPIFVLLMEKGKSPINIDADYLKNGFRYVFLLRYSGPREPKECKKLKSIVEFESVAKERNYLLRYRTYYRRHVLITSVKLKQYCSWRAQV